MASKIIGKVDKIEKIKAEIERRKNELEKDKYISIDAKACRTSELTYLERFIDSLPKAQPSEDLEKEIERVWDELMQPKFMDFYAFADFARHFAQWGTEHFREPTKKIAEDLEEETPEPYTGKYDEAYIQEKIAKATKSWEGVNVDKMLAECRGYDEQPDKSLEEAAEEYTDGKSWAKENYLTPYIREAFNAGAKWQKEQMEERWLKDREGCFWDGVEEGKKVMKEQMMKGAVEGFIFQSADYYPKELIARYEGDLKMGDKVKLIIVKED